MTIVKVDERYVYNHHCSHCQTDVRLYPADLLNSFYSNIGESTVNGVHRDILFECPVCGITSSVKTYELPCFFRQRLCQLKGWKIPNE